MFSVFKCVYWIVWGQKKKNPRNKTKTKQTKLQLKDPYSYVGGQSLVAGKLEGRDDL